jgi:hypothetical protein
MKHKSEADTLRERKDLETMRLLRRSSSLRFVNYAMTGFGSFICWNTLMTRTPDFYGLPLPQFLKLRQEKLPTLPRIMAINNLRRITHHRYNILHVWIKIGNSVVPLVKQSQVRRLVTHHLHGLRRFRHQLRCGAKHRLTSCHA